MTKIAVVLIRGLVGVNHDIKKALESIRLRKKHACVIVEDSPSMQGILKKIQDYATFGVVSDETIAKLEKARKPTEKGVFFLAPPVGGFERKGIKKPFTVGGALGDRGDQMSILLEKMM